MTKIHAGRFSAATDGPYVVFLIGMRLNKPWKVKSWLPVVKAMPQMQKELATNPDLGCLGMQNWFGRTTISVQYWRDFETLNDYARNPDHPHLPAWREFNKVVKDSGDVGIWHETYQVAANTAEAVYGNMPVFGLAAAFTHVPASVAGNSAAKRIGATDEDLTVVEPY